MSDAVWPRSKGCAASESKSGGEGAGRTWTIYVCPECGSIGAEGISLCHRARTDGIGSCDGTKREPTEVIPASDLTEALSLLEGYRTSRDSTREQLEAAEAQLADARAALEEIANAPDKFADAIADGALTKSGLAELMANSARAALSNTTPETQA